VGGDRIEFDVPSPSTITLTAGLPVITQSLEIAGPGMDKLTIDGNQTFPIIDANFNGTFLTIRGLRLYQGARSGGGCLYVLQVQNVLVEDVHIYKCRSTATGGGGASLSFSPNMTVRRVIVEANSSEQGSGGMVFSPTQEGRIEDSLFLANQAIELNSSGGGLGIGQLGNTVITRSTFAENSADNGGSAINIFSPSASVSISHTTIRNNTALPSAFSGATGGAIANIGTLSLFNTVVANNFETNPNHSNSDLSSTMGTTSTLGFNFIGSNEGAVAIFPAGTQANGDQAGTAVIPLDPKLNVLDDYGGPTLSFMPASNSPLVNKGSCPGETRDQRGYLNNATGLRLVIVGPPTAPSDGCDIGAIEYLAQPPEPLFEDGFESP
jgi:hypothetical protein